MALKEDLIIKANGLYTYADLLSEIPDGSLSIAKNIVINKDGLFSPRRGYANLDGNIIGAIESLHTYTSNRFNYLLSYRNTGSNNYLSRYNDNTSSWDDYNTEIMPPSEAFTIKTAQANKNLYLTSSKGVQKLDNINGDLIDSGAPEGLDIETVNTNVGTGSAIPNLPNAQAVAYRVVWGYRDFNNNLLLGPPSQRVVHTINGSVSGPSDVLLTVTIPTPPVTVNWFMQLYRTSVLEGTGPTSVGDPGDDMGLVLEINPEALDISAGEITVTDVTPDVLRGTDLYTNATQQGILQANYSAPYCLDMALYQNHIFYANTQTKYQLEISLLAVDQSGSNTTAITVNDTVTLDGVEYTGKITENSASNEFLIANTGSLSNNIEDTARSLIKVINKSASNSTLWAVYDSGEEDVPGKIRIFERDFGDSPSFTIESSRSGCWSPDIEAIAEISNNENKPNRLYFSKFQQPEAVPLLNFFDVGAANDEILRILPLRSILLIFTTAGVYKLTGATTNSFQVSLLDDTAILEAPDSLVALNNNAVGFFDQGVCQVSYGSVQILSRPIEGDLNAIRGTAGAKLSELTFGLSYETDRKYMIGLPTADTDTKSQIVYVYNVLTQSWTTYDIKRRNGIVRKEDDKVYFCSTDSIIQERKNFNDSDFAGPEINVTVTNVSGKILTLDNVAGVELDYLFYQDNNTYAKILSINTATNEIEVQDDLNWSTGAAEIRPFIITEIEWNPITADTPNILKQWSEATLLVNRPITEAILSFKTLTSGFFETVNLTDTSNGPWGLFAWGEVPWGGTTTIFRYRTWIPREKQRDSALILKLTQNTINNDFEISGWSLIYRDISQRVTR